MVQDVLPGAYLLQIRLTEPPEDPDSPFRWNHREIGSLTQDFVVPEAPADQPDLPFDAGVFTLQLKETGEMKD